MTDIQPFKKIGQQIWRESFIFYVHWILNTYEQQASWKQYLSVKPGFSCNLVVTSGKYAATVVEDVLR